MLFNSGNSIRWLEAKKFIIRKFREKGVWNIIQGVEDLEDEAEPVFEGRVRSQGEEAAAVVIRDSKIQRLQEARSANLIDDATVFMKTYEADNTLAEEKTKIAVRFNGYRDDHERKVERYRKIRTELNEKYERVLAVFHTYLGESALSIGREDLDDHRFLQAWNAIDLFYSHQGENASELISFLGRVKLDYESETLEEHLAFMTMIFDQLESVGQEQTEAAKAANVLDSIRRGTNQFNYTIDMCKFSNMTYQQTIQKLHDREQELTRKADPIKKFRVSKERGYAADEEEGEMRSSKKPQKKHEANAMDSGPGGGGIRKVECYRCGGNHYAKECTKKDMTCNKCGRQGHLAKMCKTKGQESGAAAAPAKGSSSKGSSGGSKKDDGKKKSEKSNTHKGKFLEAFRDANPGDSGGESSSMMTEGNYGSESTVQQSISTDVEWILVGQENKDKSIFDSGATSHMFRDKDKMDDFVPQIETVQLGSKGHQVQSIGRGSVGGMFRNCLCIPSLRCNLISVSKLDEDGYTSIFGNGKVKVFGNKNGVMYYSGKKIGNLYQFMGDHTMENEKYGQDKMSVSKVWNMEEAAAPVRTRAKDYDELKDSDDQLGDSRVSNKKKHRGLEGSERGSNPNVKKRSTANVSKIEALHRRLGHMSVENIKKVVKKKMLDGLGVKSTDEFKTMMPVCGACEKGQIKASTPIEVSTDVSALPVFHTIAADIKGPISTRSMRGNYYFQLIVDRRTNYVYAMPMKRKNQALAKFQEFYYDKVYRKQYKMSVFQSDDDAVYKDMEFRGFIIECKAEQQLSPPYSHSANGLIERQIGRVMDKARVLMAEYGCPMKYWDYAVEAACYHLNHTPNKRSGEKVPYEWIERIKPDVSGMIPFYCLGYRKVSKEEGQKDFEYKGEEVRNLGYPEGYKNAYLCRFPSGAVLVRRDITWDYNGEPELWYEEEELNSMFFELGITTDEVLQSMRELETGDNGVSVDEDIDSVIEEALSVSGTGVVVPPNPPSVKAALEGTDGHLWREAIEKELRKFDERGTFVFKGVPQEGHGMKMKCILNYQLKNDYSIKRKCRVVVCGYSQVKGIDYDQTYSPTTSTASIMLVLLMFSIKRGTEVKLDDIWKDSGKWVKKSIDFTSAFTLPQNDFTNMFGYLPLDLTGGKKVRVRVDGCCYGEKQAGKIWNDTLDVEIVGCGFTRCVHDPCVYYMFKGETRIILVVHVDDVLMIGNNEGAIIMLIKALEEATTPITVYDDVSRYLGFDFHWVEGGKVLKLNQFKYLQDIVGEFDKDGTKLVKTPVPTNVDYRSQNLVRTDANLLPLVGKLRFAADRTRPDIQLGCSILSSKATRAPIEFQNLGKRTVQYIRTTMDESLQFGTRDKKLKFFGFSDAGMRLDGDSKPQLGIVLFGTLDSGAIISQSKSGPLIVGAVMLAEIQACVYLIVIVLFIQELASELGEEQEEPTPIYMDSLSAIKLSETIKSTNKTKYMLLYINFMRQELNNRRIRLVFVRSGDNVADYHTKALTVEVSEKHRGKIMRGFGNVPIVEESVAFFEGEWWNNGMPA